MPVFYIPLSNDRPHLPSTKHRRVFWKRINGGRESVTYLEILMAFQNYEERRGKIKLLYVELLANKIALQDILEAAHAEDQSTYSPSTLEYVSYQTTIGALPYNHLITWSNCVILMTYVPFSLRHVIMAATKQQQLLDGDSIPAIRNGLKHS